MALADTIGGAASELFAGFGATKKAKLQAQGLKITAAGTLIGAESTRIGAESTRIGAQGTRLGAEGLRIKARGDLAEAENLDLAAELAERNRLYTEASTRIQQFQSDRQVTQALGRQGADVAGAGFANSGSALDLMRDSASQGALAHGVLGMQGQIVEDAYEEQRKSYETMSTALRATAAAQMGIADRTDVIADRTDLIAGRQDLIAGRQEGIAAQQVQLANETEELGKFEATGHFVGSAIKGITAIAQIAAAFA